MEFYINKYREEGFRKSPYIVFMIVSGFLSSSVFFAFILC